MKWTDDSDNGEGSVKLVFPVDQTCMVLCDGHARPRFFYLDQLELIENPVLKEA